ncbi:hypothetical protein TcYC6_0003650 [Trypanosoma cruzi]|nr:hypothetical protein TcYC6_0003650 [Trypanosoma cruzi]
MNGEESETLSVQYLFCVFMPLEHQTTLNIRCLEEFASSCPQGCCTRLIVFERLLHSTRCGPNFCLSELVNGESQRTLSFISVCGSLPGHQTTPELSACLEEFRELLTTRVLHSADRFRASLASHVVVQIFVSDYEWWESEDTLCQYLFACSTLDTKQP